MLRLALPILALVLLLGLAAISDRPLPRADLTIINRGDVSTLDLATMSWMQDLRIARSIYEGLVMTDPFSWEYALRPGVAQSWERSADGLVYTFHLRADARWSNADPVLVSDFCYSWLRAIIPDSAGDYAKFFSAIRGVRDFTAWRTAELARFANDRTLTGDARRAAAQALWTQTQERFARDVGVRTPDERTIVIELEHPVPYFLDLLAFPTLYPQHARTLRLFERVQPDSGRVQWEQGWTKPPHHVTNGPLLVSRWRFKRDLRLEKNPHYWNRDAIAINSIDIPTIEDDNTEVLAFRSGAVDWASDVTAPYRAEIHAQKLDFLREHQTKVDALRAQGLDPIAIDRALPSDPRNTFSVLPAFGTYFYNFNCSPTLADGRRNPFADPRVRRAFALAVDKRALVDDVRRVGESIAPTLIPPDSIPGYASPRGLSYDPPRARALLAEAGYASGKDFPVVVEILFNKDGGHDLAAQVIAKNWESNLGVQVLLNQRELRVFREDLKNGNFMVSRAGWFGDYGDPTTFLDIHRTGDGNNDRKFSNPQYDALLDRAAIEPDPARRMELLSKAEQMLVEEQLPFIPLYHYAQFYLFDPHRVSGISAHPRQEQHLYLMSPIRSESDLARARAMPPHISPPHAPPGGAAR